MHLDSLRRPVQGLLLGLLLGDERREIISHHLANLAVGEAFELFHEFKRIGQAFRMGIVRSIEDLRGADRLDEAHDVVFIEGRDPNVLAKRFSRRKRRRALPPKGKFLRAPPREPPRPAARLSLLPIKLVRG